MREHSGPEGAPVAPLAAAFLRRQVGAYPSYVKFLVSARAPEGIVAMPEYVLTDQARMERGVVRQDPPAGAGHESHEDATCHARLRRLGMAGRGYECGAGATLDGLAALVAGLNAERPRRLRLDRAIIGTAARNVLFGGGRVPPCGGRAGGVRRPYENVVVTNEAKFLHHHAIPGDTAYVMSSRQAPIFVYGPEATGRSGGAEVTTRESGLVEPPGGLPECPWGYRLAVSVDGGA